VSDTNALTMDLPMPASLLDTGAQGLIGGAVDRIDGPKKVSGTATYAAEYGFDDIAYGYLVSAPGARGEVTAIDVAAVRAIPGVIDVVIDFETFLRNSQQGGEKKAPVQGVKDIRYYGEPVALVLAESFEVARDAGERIAVHIEEKPGRFDFAALHDEAEKPPFNNIEPHYSQGDIDAAMASAATALDVTYTTPSQTSAAMEPHASIASWDADGVLTVHGSYQMVASNRTQLADALGLKADKVRIIARYVGGGFGAKLGIAPEVVAAALAAKRNGRPVKVVMTRQQVFDATVRRSNTEQRVRLGADATGKLCAIGHETVATNLPEETFFEPAGISTHFLYAGENRLITHDLVRMDQLLSGSMRAPGEAAGMLALECAMDELAEKLDLDPVELRRRNDPQTDPEKHLPYSTRQFVRCLDEGAARFGWETRQSKPGNVREGEWLIGIGMAAAARSNKLQNSAATVSIGGDGRVTVATDMTDIGTGTYTVLGQIAGELLGVPLDQIEVRLGDTESPPGAGSGGSWGAASSGSSVYLACERLREQLAEAMDCAADALTLKDGNAVANNRSVPLATLVGDGMEARGEIAPGKMDEEFTQASYGAHFAEVGVNRVTGEVRMRRMLGVFSAGRILNAKTARSQALGGMTFGIGAALTEELIHDARNGKLVNHDLAEYHVPVNADVPQLEVHFIEERDQFANPLQSKGLGELGICGAGAAIANAIYNACGVRVRDYPLTLDKILDGLPAI
jgi:xanthine dehydrogenase YagR molybdenum-binding subunit